MLVEVADVRMSFEARQVLLGTHFVSAVALVGNTVVDRVVAAALLRDQVCPHGYFTSLDEGSLRLARSAAPDTFEEATL